MSRNRLVDSRRATHPPSASSRANHPRGLYILCASVAFERFSFFLFSALFVLYLNEHARMPAPQAVETYGYFLCASYVTPLLGGWLCDGRMGYRHTALIGTFLQALGYLMLTIRGAGLLLAALASLSLGSGLFKAGSQALLGNLYASDDDRRESGFRTLYVAINVGALAAPLIGERVQSRAGWAWGFATAGFAALLSAALLTPDYAPCAVSAHAVSVQTPPSPDVPTQRARRHLALVLAAGLVFGASLAQSHSSLLVWIRDRTDRHLGPFEIPVAWFAAAPAALVLLFAPLVTGLFAALRRRGREPSALRKVAIGLIVSGLAFAPIWLFSLRPYRGLRVSALWAIASLAILAVGELLAPALAPSVISQMASPNRRGRWLSYWFLAMAAGHMLGGWIRL